MDKEYIEQALFILSMVTGDCPYQMGIGEEIDNPCKDYINCVDCWKIELSKELKRMGKDS